jgi:ADP-heptose:LPS heptosyltransferase
MRILIIRFSSFGDIFQTLEAAAHIKQIDSAAKIDWLVRRDFAELLENQSLVHQVIAFDRKNSAFNLIRLSWKLAPNYSRVFDAHNNLRSLLVRIVIRLYWTLHYFSAGKNASMITRSKDRWRRFLFFKFRLPVLPKPFRGAESFLRPLRSWYPELAFKFESATWTASIQAKNFEDEVLNEFNVWKGTREGLIVAFAPSAAWPNKRWPIDRWLKLARAWLVLNPSSRFLLLGGPEDTFLHQIGAELGPDTVYDSVGKSSLAQSARLLSQVNALVANDTGLLHVADRLTLPSVAIIGPTAFGYPASLYSRVAEVELPCKPCSKDGRDRCTNSENLKCLKLVSTEQVVELLTDALASFATRESERRE